jgi:hypothetical protein
VNLAEKLRQINVKVMDMYGTQGSASATSAPGMATASGPTLVQSAVEEWIDFAIVFEQMQ